jgi:uncharacterized membrane protein (UPF0136 family)
MGYVRQRSTMSLVAGLGLGTLYGTSAYLLKENKQGGIELATATSVLLTGAMLPRAIKTKKPIPIAMGVVGVLGLVYYGKKYYEQIVGV